VSQCAATAHHQEVVSIGTLSASLVHPREIYSPAIIHSAAAVVAVHNHPSGIRRRRPRIVRRRDVYSVPESSSASSCRSRHREREQFLRLSRARATLMPTEQQPFRRPASSTSADLIFNQRHQSIFEMSGRLLLPLYHGSADTAPLLHDVWDVASCGHCPQLS